MPAACSTCGHAIEWATTLDGARMPMDPGDVEPGPGVVAVNERTGRCKVLAFEDIAKLPAWRGQGAVFRVAHWATCPSAVEHRRPGQDRLF